MACALLLFLSLVAGAGLASIPDFNAALARCSQSVSYNATCQPLLETSACSPFFASNAAVYVPLGMSQSDIEHSVGVALVKICTTHYFPCLNSGNPYEPLPILPCARFCGDFWGACNASFFLYWSQELKTDYSASSLPNCLYGGTFQSTWTSGSLSAQPQPPDVWGGRVIPSFGLLDIFGLNGSLLFPDGAYEYTFSNGSTASLMCYTPNLSTTVVTLPVPDCSLPMVVSADGSACDIPCPFPVFTTDTQIRVEWAFVAPALLGLVLCVFICVDALFVIGQASGGRRRRMLRGMMSSGSHNDVSSSNSPDPTSGGSTGDRQVRVSTLYVLLGSMLGIVYFLIGPLMTLLYWSDVSCSEPTLSLQALTTGTMPREPSACVAQRASPFVLQAIFNLILYAMVRVYLVISNQVNHMKKRFKKLVDIALLGYCVGVPMLTLILAFTLDELSTNLYTGSVQLSRQSTICQFRLSVGVEWILTFAPFIVTGLAVTGMSVLITLKLLIARGKLGPASNLKTRSSSEVALQLLIFRLVVLGLVTFIVLIIVIGSTSIMTNELDAFTPAFSTYFTCSIEQLSCLNCSQWNDVARDRKPNPTVLGLQLASMSCIVVLFGLFFGAQSVLRLYKEYMGGSVNAKITKLLGGERTTLPQDELLSGSKSVHDGTQLNNILATPALTEALYGHLSKEHSNENLEFLFLVENYKARWMRTAPVANRVLAEKIFRDYIDMQGKAPITLSSLISNNLERCIASTDELSRNVFDDAALEISKMVERDGLARFVLTPRFEVERMVQSLDKE